MNRFARWETVLPASELERAERLAERALQERNSGKTVYPPQEDIFRALELVAPEDVKAVIVGQDPYINENQATGLAFSVSEGEKLPPSLRNIFKELCADVGCETPESGDLTKWAERGVLLLNTTLTVEAGKSNSHVGWGWNEFTKAVCKSVCSLPQPVVFILWGNYARAFVSDLFQETNQYAGNKRYITSSHPSPLGATKASKAAPAFMGSRPFSTANALLMEMGTAPIDWKL